MDTKACIDRVFAFCRSIEYLPTEESISYIADYSLRSISPVMAATVFVVQTLALEHTTRDIVRIMNCAIRASECIGALKRALQSGEITPDEFRDAGRMLTNFMDPSDAAARFSHSFLAKFGTIPLCEDTREK